MCNCKHRCFELQEITTSAAQVYLPDNSKIRENLVTSISVVGSDPAGSLTFKSPLGANLASWSVLNSSYLYVFNQNGTRIATIPLALLIRTVDYPEPLQVSWVEVDPTQTYIQINTGAAGYSATAAILVEFGLACNECGLTPNSSASAKQMAKGTF